MVADDVNVVEEEGLVHLIEIATFGVAAGIPRGKNQAAFFRPPPVSSKTSSREISMRMPEVFVWISDSR